MIRLIKFLITLLLAAIAAGLSLLVLFFLMPSWQEGAVRRVLDEDPHHQWQIGEARVLPTAFEVGDGFFLGNGIGISVERFALQGPLWQALFVGHLRVTGGEIDGLRVDLTKLPVLELTLGGWFKAFADQDTQARFYESKLLEAMRRADRFDATWSLENVAVSGELLLPGGVVRSLNWTITEMDNRDGGRVNIEVKPQP